MKDSMIYLIAALVFTFILGFIDEGYYSLRTFESIGNILVLGVYLLLFWCTELFADWALQKVLPPEKALRRTLSVVIGLFLPITIIMLVAN